MTVPRPQTGHPATAQAAGAAYHKGRALSLPRIPESEGDAIMPPDASTPITIGLFWVAAFGFVISCGFLIWLWQQMKGLKAEILGIVTQETEQSKKAMLELGVKISGVDGKVTFVNEKVHALELAAANQRAETAEKFMSKQSAGLALDRVSTEIADMKRDLGDRLNSIEHHLRVEPHQSKGSGT